MTTHRVSLAAIIATMTLAGSAQADMIGPGQGSIGHVTAVGKGVKELGVESMFVMSSTSVAESKADAKDDSSSMRLTFTGGAVFRYFLAKNLPIGLHVGGLYRSASASAGGADLSTVTDKGFIGTVGADYLVSLSRGMFLVPGFSVGGFFTTAEHKSPASTIGTTTTPESTDRYGQSGFAVRAGLGLTYYASPHFTLSARPEALVLLGSSKLTESGGQTVTGDAAASRGFTSIDGGFSVGLAYVF
jgi:hypothetical protein